MALGPLLLLLSALLHAAWNACAKASQDKEAFLFVTMTFGGFISLFCVLVFGDFHMPSSTVWFSALASGLFEGAYLLSLGKALQKSSLGTSYAIMRGGAMILVWTVSLIFLAEQASGLQYLGALIILVGIFVMNHSGLGQLMAFKSNFWSYLSALFIAGYHLCYHHALDAKADPLSLFTVSVFVSLPLAFWGVMQKQGLPAVQRLLSACRNEPRSVAFTSLTSMASFVIFLFGLQMTEPGFAISLRNTSIFFALILSYFLGETLTRVQIVGACTIGVGALLLAF